MAGESEEAEVVAAGLPGEVQENQEGVEAVELHPKSRLRHLEENRQAVEALCLDRGVAPALVTSVPIGHSPTQ